MLECKRVLFRPRSLLLIGILLLFNGIFFLYQCNDLKSNTLTKQELLSYVEEYPAYVEAVLKNADEMMDNPLFSDTTSFVYRNLLKTKQDFMTLSKVVPKYGENRGITTVMGFQLTEYFLLFLGTFFVMSFLAERQKGLYLLVRCTQKGRFPLTLQRIGTLIWGLTICGLLFYGSVLILGKLLFVEMDLLRPVQSIPEFSGVTWQVSIATYLLFFLFERVLGCIVCCLFLYFCLSLFQSSICVILFLGIFLGEYLLYVFLSPTTYFSFLKYMNLYAFIFRGMDYGHYYNLNLWNHAVPAHQCVLVFVLLLLVILVPLILWRYTCQYPKNIHSSFAVIERIKILISKRKPILSPFLWECRKILISQKALFILIGVIYLAWSASGESSYLDYRSKYVTHWYREYTGEINDKMHASMVKRQTKMEDKLERLKASLVVQQEIYERYEIAGYSLSAVQENIRKLTRAIYDYEHELWGLDIVLDQVENGLEYRKRTGLPMNLVDVSSYELLLSEDYQTTRRNHLYVLLAVILMVSGIMCCERTTHMEPLLHTLYRGGRGMLARKIILMLFLCIGCALSIHMIQFVQIGRVYPFTNWDAIAQSIPCARSFPFSATIRTYVGLVYFSRVLVSVGFGAAVMTISYYSKSRIVTIAISIFLLVIPVVALSLWM